MKKIFFVVLLVVIAVLLVFQTNLKLQNNDFNDGSDISVDEETPEQKEEKEILAIIENMTLNEKVCQMFIVAPESLSMGETVQKVSQAFKSGLEDYPVGGIICFASNVGSRTQLKQMLSDMSKLGEIPMFLSVDQEGGKVARLKENVGFPLLESMYAYRNEGEEIAYKNAKTIAEEMKKLGFNLDFAPVADVWSNKNNTVIGERAYSDDFSESASLVSAAVKGFHDGGVMCTLKHFPGHGDTFVDTHNALAYVSKTKTELNFQEILPFQAGITAGADMVMIGHLVIKDIDDKNPATLSEAVVTDYLKQELGFDGVVITDSMAMGAVSTLYGSGELSVRAINAGVDIVLMPKSLSVAVEGVLKAVNDGRISEERIDESVKKILKLKRKYGLYN